ncbi:hypothetical protein [Clostridium sp. UBA5988]|uniref:hypothetical protein n=1 Tax=Clostridium sp. UBA5988 TaxID=1946369 RepID=UPI0032178686
MVSKYHLIKFYFKSTFPETTPLPELVHPSSIPNPTKSPTFFVEVSTMVLGRLYCEFDIV